MLVLIFLYDSIETHAYAILTLNILAIAGVGCIILEEHIAYWIPIHYFLLISFLPLYFQFIFAVIAVQLFNGKFFFCTDESKRHSDQCQ